MQTIVFFEEGTYCCQYIIIYNDYVFEYNYELGTLYFI